MNRSRITGDLVSQNNIFVNTANDRVGIGSTIPTNKLDIRGIVESRSAINFHNGLWTGETTKIQLQSNFLHIQGGSSGTMFRRLSGGNCWSITGAGHFQVQADSTYDIGTNATRVRNIYADTLYGDGANLTNTGSSLSEPSSGTQRLVTTSLTSGTMTSSGTGSELAFDYANNHLEFLDSVKATFGTDGDLELYHDGSHSYIHDGGTGNLKVRSNNFRVSNADESKLSATFVPSGAVQLYYDNSQKLGTAGWGVQIQGILKVLDATDANGSTNNLSIGSGNDLKLYHTGTNNHVDSVNGKLVLRSDTFQLSTLDGTHRYIDIPTDEQGVSLFYDNVKRLETTSSGVDVTGTVTADNQIVLNSGDSTPARIDLYCEVSNAHYTRLQAPAHSTYSGNVTVTIPNTSGNLAVLANAANNRVVTATGTHGMTGESNLSFNGSTLAVGGSSDVKLLLTGSNNPYIQFQEGTTNKAYIQWSASGNYLQFGNEEAGEVLRLGDGESGLIWRVGTNDRTVWTSGNDGASSGLDADLLDGVQGSSYLRSDVNDAQALQRIEFKANETYNYDTIATASGNQGCIEIFNNGDGNDAFMAFNTGSDFAFYFGLDGDTNKLAVGGWSMGANKYAIYHENNNPTFSQLGITASSINALGINATTLDSIDSGSFLRSDADDSVSAYTNQIRFPSNSAINSGSSSQASLEVYQGTASSDAFMAFHVAGDFAAYFGLDGGTNDFAVGGWSMGAVSNKVWHAGNDGSGSGLDADTLDGMQPSAVASNSTIVQRNGNGYVFANYFNTTANDTGTAADVTRFYCSEDAYIRYIDKASMRSVMNTSAVSGAFGGRETATSDTNYWVGSAGWGTSNFDTTVWDFGSCFFDTWSNPSGQPSGTSHWTGVQAMHYTNQSNRYGMRITSGAGNPALAYIAGIWGSTSYGWQKLWNAGNDGSGSGLDADTVDGIQGSSLLRSDTADTASGDITFSGGAHAVHINGNSDIRLANGSWTGDYSCKIQHHDNYLYMQGGSNGHIFRRSNGNNAWIIDSGGTLRPGANNTYNLGASNYRIANVYANDLQLSNEVKKDTGGNDVDGTWGDWTLQEGEEKIFMINNRTGKKYSLMMKEEG